jgi:exopolysaccharide biosynthesis polyprenyl glycosylphosphotransferase
VRGLAHLRLVRFIRRGELYFDTVGVIGDRVSVLDFLLNSELWRHGHRLAGALYSEDLNALDANERRAAVAEFGRMTLRRGARHIVLVGDIGDLGAVDWIVDELRRFAVNVVGAPAAGNRLLKFLDVMTLGPNNALRFSRRPLSNVEVLAKRGLDLIGAVLGLILLSPLLLGVAAAIVITTGRPVIYRQERRGFNGEPFLIWKFRSMSVTESGRSMHQAEKNDARVTPVGRFIRATSIDELPQLFNVLLGQMSLVGPRPHAISHDDALEHSVARYAHRQRIKPGITGWAQVNGYRGETRTPDQMEGRTQHDLYYIDNWSLVLDIWIIVLTIVSRTAHRNAH